VKTFDKGDLDDTVQADFIATAYTLAGTANEPAKQPGACRKQPSAAGSEF
jgi:hypothetical protein